MKRQWFNILLMGICIAILAIGGCKKSEEPQAAEQPAKIETVEQLKAEEAESAQPTPEQQAKPDAEKTTANNDEMAPINIELPKPMFVGTPQNLNLPNLEKPLGKPRPPFLAPVGTTNLAAGKPVTGSDEEPIIGELSMITDGDKEGGEGSYVELGPFVQYVTIDLQTRANIYAIVMWHYHQQARAYKDVIVQISDDPDFITDVTTVFNNDHDNSAGLGIGSDMHYVETAEGKLIDAKGVQGRYVRLYSNGSNSNDLNHYIEVQVYGKPVE